jgi:hypothetical protein
MNEPSIHIRNFNDKIKLMNQTQRRDLVLSAAEARSLHAEIYGLLAQVADLVKRPHEDNTVNISMDGGGFK